VALPAALMKETPDETGESLSFDAVYRRHAGTVARWCSRLLGPGADAEDLTQEVFVVVNRRLACFRQDARLTTWLFRIADRLAANQRRRHKVRRWLGRLTPELEARAPSRDPSPLEQIESRERQVRFYDVLEGLRESHRKVLILFELEELAGEEIAELMDMKVGNVRVLLHRARAAFLAQMIKLERKEIE
jgi:RNA polymerase sigma-70 factor (ECF subfamily)